MDNYINFTEGMADTLEVYDITPSERGEIVLSVIAYLFEGKPLPRFDGDAANRCAATFFYEAVMANPAGPTTLTEEERRELFG